MNPSTACARVLIDELLRLGVRDFVLAPGSRSAPLAYAALAAERSGALRLHVRIDERSAGFLALGLALGTGRVVPVVVTSGTAVANLHPAVLEAHHSRVPFLVLSADRPQELRGTGANQTTHQSALFGDSLRYAADLPAESVITPAVAAAWRSTLDRALAAGGPSSPYPGPVQVNVGLRDPLVEDLAPEQDAPVRREPGTAGAASLVPWPELQGRRGGHPWVQVALSATPAAPLGDALPRVEETVVVLGGGLSRDQAEQAVSWANAEGYPVLAEPFGEVDRDVIPHGPLLLTVPSWVEAHAPRRVLVAGRPTLSRPLAALLRLPGVTVEAIGSAAELAGGWSDPGHRLAAVHPWSVLHAGPSMGGPGAFAQAWRSAGERLAEAVEADPPTWGTGLALARALVRALPEGAGLFVGPSNPVRDLDLMLHRRRGRFLVIRGNRGLAGIDGCVSTASGLALAAPDSGGSYAYVGDLTFLHDQGALVGSSLESRPDLTVVVANDDGGGIFATLEHGEPPRAGSFERLFATPTGADLEALCTAHGIRHDRVTDEEGLVAALSDRPAGLRVVEVPIDRESHRAAHERLRALAAQSLT